VATPGGRDRHNGDRKHSDDAKGERQLDAKGLHLTSREDCLSLSGIYPAGTGPVSPRFTAFHPYDPGRMTTVTVMVRVRAARAYRAPSTARS
jgi:hypothetical protein